MSEWDRFALYYDLYFRDRTVDVNFWVSQALSSGSPVLELTCGTGRLTFPIAEAGVQIVGLDVSHEMLSVAKKKLGKTNASVRRNIRLIEADATDFVIPDQKFSAIFSPWGFVAVTQDEQDSLCTSVRQCLQPNGYFIVDVYNHLSPKEDWESFGIQDYKRFSDKGLTIIRQVLSRGEAKTKIGHMLFMWDIVKANGQLKRVITERTERLYPRGDMERLLSTHGFRIEQIYGNYDKSPWSKSSPRTIVVSRKR